MNNSELIADKIEEVIRRMFVDSISLHPRASEYSIFYDPKKHASWFIVIFFTDRDQLSEGLKNGACYKIYSYLLHELNEVKELSNIGRSISFESGNRPVEKKELNNLFQKLIEKKQSLQNVSGIANIRICGSCGHDFDNHQLLGEKSEENSAPTEGWIICPEKDCNCFLTWGANYKGA